MSKELEVKVTINIKDEWVDQNDLSFYSIFTDKSTDAIKRKIVDEIASKYANMVTLEDLDIKTEDIKAEVRNRIIDKIAESGIENLGLGDN